MVEASSQLSTSSPTFRTLLSSSNDDGSAISNVSDPLKRNDTNSTINMESFMKVSALLLLWVEMMDLCYLTPTGQRLLDFWHSNCRC
jgi:hypothetical protein